MNKSSIISSERKGFTLIELVVVIAILGILMSIAIPKVSGFIDKAALKADQATAATIGKAIELYMIDENSIQEKTLSQTDDILTSLESADLIVKDNCKPQFKKDNLNFQIIYNDKKVKISYSSDVKVGKNIYKELYPTMNPGNTKPSQ